MNIGIRGSDMLSLSADLFILKTGINYQLGEQQKCVNEQVSTETKDPAIHPPPQWNIQQSRMMLYRYNYTCRPIAVLKNKAIAINLYKFSQEVAITSQTEWNNNKDKTVPYKMY